jgi:hypothetical protein
MPIVSSGSGLNPVPGNNFAEYLPFLPKWRDFRTGFLKQGKTKNIYGADRDNNA